MTQNNNLDTHKDGNWYTIWKVLSIPFSLLYWLIRLGWYIFVRIFFLTFLLFLTVWLAWWLSQKPSLYRDWEEMDAILPKISWSGNIVTVENIRDFTWKTDVEFTPRYYTQTYNLNDIEKMYYIITPFSQYNWPAHTMLSFSFSWGKNVVISAELRKERGESFDVIRWALNQYELAYVIASEEDVIKLRTNYRKNETYMYPINTPKEKIQWIFRSMLIRANKISREPEFYNTFWNNCTTSVLFHANAFRNDKLIGWFYTLLPSHSDEILFNEWLIDTTLSPQNAREYYRIDEIARTYTGSKSFSEIIRK